MPHHPIPNLKPLHPLPNFDHFSSDVVPEYKGIFDPGIQNFALILFYPVDLKDGSVGVCFEGETTEVTGVDGHCSVPDDDLIFA
jgi:hypothetical protein